MTAPEAGLTFEDETFFARAQRVGELADRIIESGMKITWATTMRADQGLRLSEEVWARCKQSALRRLLVGVESVERLLTRWIVPAERLS